MKSMTFTDKDAMKYLTGAIEDSVFGHYIHSIVNDRLVHNIHLLDRNFTKKEVELSDLNKYGLLHRVFLNKLGTKQRNILERNGKQVGDVFDIIFDIQGDQITISYELKKKVEMQKKKMDISFMDWFRK